MMDALIRFWRSRVPRERLVLAGAALLVLALGFAYGWLPLQREAAQLRQTLPQLRAQAQQLQQEAQEAARLRARPAANPGTGSPASAVEQRALAMGLRGQIESIVPQDAGRVRVVLPQVAFDAWIGWLGELQARDGVRVESAQIEAAGVAGMVRVDAVLAGG
ncbi:type II secretion system protein GspM [Thiobacillus sp.]|uniref:type II secretion system protein GspM n=1 Tax=Thiobacillus sp. TaxID=924 RepID=UPI0025F7800E|nr:type II secretion system protein GspM [Thiobacillus sp.]